MAARFTTENVAYVSFSIDADCFTDKKSEFRIQGKKFFQPSTIQGLKFLAMLFFPFILNFVKIGFITKEFDRWFRNIINCNIESRKTEKLSNEDLLQMLLTLKEKNSN